MIDHCETLKDRFAILDPQPRADSATITAQRNLLGSDNGYAALYYPRLVISDPRPAGGGPHHGRAVRATWPGCSPARTTPGACSRRRPTRRSTGCSTSSARSGMTPRARSTSWASTSSGASRGAVSACGARARSRWTRSGATSPSAASLRSSRSSLVARHAVRRLRAQHVGAVGAGQAPGDVSS